MLTNPLPKSTTIIKFVQYLPLLQGDLALFLTADERPVTPEHSVPSPHQMSKGCWEETDPVFNYPLKNPQNIQTLKELTRGRAAFQSLKTQHGFCLYLYKV